MIFSSVLLAAFLIWMTCKHFQASSAYAKVRVRNQPQAKNHLDR